MVVGRQFSLDFSQSRPAQFGHSTAASLFLANIGNQSQCILPGRFRDTLPQRHSRGIKMKTSMSSLEVFSYIPRIVNDLSLSGRENDQMCQSPIESCKIWDASPWGYHTLHTGLIQSSSCHHMGFGAQGTNKRCILTAGFAMNNK